MSQQQGNEGQQQGNPIQVVAQNLDMQVQMHTGMSLQVQGIDAEALKRGFVRLLDSRAELLGSLRNALVTQQDMGMLVVAQLAASGGLAQGGAMAEIISAARHMATLEEQNERRIIS